MQTVLIIAAIFAAVVLIVRFAAPPSVPKFDGDMQRIPDDTALRNIKMTGKRCAKTRRGFGIAYSSVKIKDVIRAVRKKVLDGNNDEWCLEICRHSDTLLNAFAYCRRDIIMGSKLGHVGKYPRVFLFCEQAVRYRVCDIGESYLNSALSVFEEFAPLTSAERERLPGYMVYCLLGYLSAFASAVLRETNAYEKGFTDGKTGKIDLDRIASDGYVCGLVNASARSETNAVERILEANDIDLKGAYDRRRERSARMYAAVRSVLRSLQTVIRFAGNSGIPSVSEKKISKGYVRFFDIVLPSLIVLFAVFTAVFASPKYVALFFVASALTYGVMRLPLLINSNGDTAFDVNKITVKLRSFLRKKTVRNDTVPQPKRLMSETAYFGGETEYYSNELFGKTLTAKCDNRGNIELRHGGDIGKLDITYGIGGKHIGLSGFCGACQRHRSVYRTFDDEIEMTAEIILPIDCTACLVRITAVNRTHRTRRVKTVCTYMPSGRSRERFVPIGTGFAEIESGFIGLKTDRGSGGEASQQCFAKPYPHVSCDNAMIAGETYMDIPPFATETVYATLSYGSCIQETDRTDSYARGDDYFEYAADCADVYADISGRATDPRYFENDRLYMRPKIKDAVYGVPNLRVGECAAGIDGYYYKKDGERVVDRENAYLPTVENIIGDGVISVLTTQKGITDIVCCGKSVSDDCSGSDTCAAAVVLGEDGVIWSPTSAPAGKGSGYAEFGFGHTEYVCAYNGTVSKLNCFAARGKSAVYFDLSVENFENCVRTIDVMFSVCIGDDSGDMRFKDGNVLKDRKKVFGIQCSRNILEYAAYKEAYYTLGEVDRVKSFRSGGSVFAPTVAVSVTVGAKKSSRAVFCFSVAGTQNEDEKIDETSADNCFLQSRKFYKRLGRTSLYSGDAALNIMYRRSAYETYLKRLDRSYCGLDKYFILNAQKYFDRDAVRRYLTDILSDQDENGWVSENPKDGLYIACAVADYVKYAGDGTFVNEILSYRPRRSRRRTIVCRSTVAEHCMRAIDVALRFCNNTGNNTQSVVNIFEDKITVELLHFFAAYCKSNLERYKTYSVTLRNTAERYSRSAKYLRCNNLFGFSCRKEAYLCAKLLFSVGEYEKAYNILKYNNPIERLNVSSDAFDAVTACENTDNGYAVYYVTVTECLMGLECIGHRVRIAPCIADNAPDIEFDLLGHDRDTRITVDGSVPNGNWRMKIDKINYSSNSVDIGDISGNKIIFYRDGSA